MNILIIEDDESLGNWLVENFRQHGHEGRLLTCGAPALERLRDEVFDVMVLDRQLPDIDGLTLFSSLGSKAPPTLILSGLNQPQQRVEGLRAGAFDYLGKPFHFPELMVRLERLAQAAAGHSPSVLEVSDLRMNLQTREVSRNGVPIDLTDKEFRMLEVLMRHSGHTVTRPMLLKHVWGYQFDPQTNLVNVHLFRLRSKIDGGAPVQLLKTVRGLGYVLG